ncbi:aldehyde dehydrogenase family protein [Streptomyces sp. NBC_00727]
MVLTLEHLAWAARNAERVLRRRKAGTGPLHRPPAGVTGAPAARRDRGRRPLQLPSLGYALAAENAVVFKPSGPTPGTGLLPARLFDAAVPARARLLTVVTGPGSTGDALARAGEAAEAMRRHITSAARPAGGRLRRSTEDPGRKPERGACTRKATYAPYGGLMRRRSSRVHHGVENLRTE